MVLILLAAGVAFLQYLFTKTKTIYPTQTAAVVSDVHKSMAVVSRVGGMVDGLKFIQRALFAATPPQTTIGGITGTRYLSPQVASDVHD